jgi:hypothetical protein
MRYALLVYGHETRDAFAIAAQDQERFQTHMSVSTTNPAIQATVILYSTMTATTLRFQAGRQILADGPAGETTEQLGALYLVTCHYRTEALALAKQLAHVHTSAVEVRPICEAGFLLP